MAAPYFEKSTGIVVIEWYETKETSSSPTRHHFEGKPIKLQLHPKDKSQVIRIYFEGKMPSWINRYIKEKVHPFECKEIFQNGLLGWWIANWRRFDIGKPFNAPTIKGCINAFVNLIPSEVEDYRERVRSEMDTIAANLSIDPMFYEPFGLYYRPEEITGEGGAMVVDEDLFPVRMSEETDQDFENRIRSHGRLDRLIFELTTPLPVVSTVADEETEVGSSELEEEFELAFEEEGEFHLDFEEDGEFTLHQGEDSLMGLSLDFAEDEGADSLTIEWEEAEIEANEAEIQAGADSIESADETEQPVPSVEKKAVLSGDSPDVPVAEGEKKEAEIVSVAKGSVESDANGAEDHEESDDLLRLHVVDNSNHKHCAVAGQLSFF
ncbi:hypothetical protein M5X11_12375 [Paenibacillus alginolyticus]|uniref:hypothetical protein n=1 Tax=Paenibacillus alginolyticus TaxID=59839 RepID=UPI0004122FB8|nr:hypothetical protein [Paenibacillus alginolyticus]MCY9665751.1 hypothetical protein [Paenibacillus alginolyticus]